MRIWSERWGCYREKRRYCEEFPGVANEVLMSYKNPPLLGRASIAFGYTPSAGAGKPGSPPGPLKGGSRARTHNKERDFILKKKTTIITARLTPSEKAAIQNRAKRAKMTMTDYLVQCALGKKIIQVEGLGEILSELKAQGHNLNQLATLANMGRVSVVQSADLIAAYSKLCSQLEKIAGEVNS